MFIPCNPHIHIDNSLLFIVDKVFVHRRLVESCLVIVRSTRRASALLELQLLRPRRIFATAWKKEIVKIYDFRYVSEIQTLTCESNSLEQSGIHAARKGSNLFI